MIFFKTCFLLGSALSTSIYVSVFTQFNLKFKFNKNSGRQVSRLIHLIEFNENNLYTLNIFLN